MTPDEYGRKLDRLITNLQTQNTPFKIAVQTTHALRMQRIFQRGEKADGSLIGHYSTKPMLAGNKTFPNKGAAQKFFKSKPKWVTIQRGGKNQPLAIIEGGYKQFRQYMGRPVNFIDLGLTYDLRFDLSNSKSLNSPGTAEKVSPNEYIERLKRPYNVKKFSGLEDRFGNIGGFQNKERTEFNRILQVELTNFLK